MPALWPPKALFTRYVQEKNDIGQDAYVRELMGSEEYAEYEATMEGTDK